ncbi:MAG TPA: PEP-CTERM sorting domain-containing protein, partial [Gemmatimonadales bacterium]
GLCSTVQPDHPTGTGDLATCPYGNEIGDADTSIPGGSLFLDFSGLDAGTVLTQIFLGSVQPLEGATIMAWNGASYVSIYDALGGSVGDVVTFDYTPAMAALYGALPKLRFDYKAPLSGELSDYLVMGATVSPVPEPGTMGLLATGLVALTGAGYLRRRKK